MAVEGLGSHIHFLTVVTMFAISNKCIASSNKCLTSSNKKFIFIVSNSFLLLLVRPLLLEAMHLFLVAYCLWNRLDTPRIIE